jgi:hypothetical protein
MKRISFNFSENRGRYLENIVFLELLRRGKQLYYHKGKYECDFLVREGIAITEAIQVCKELTEANREREFNGLLEALNNYGLDKGFILTEDQQEIIKQDKLIITVLPIWKWLVSEEV